MALDRIQKLTELAQKADPITESATGGVSANEDAFVNSAFDSNEGDGNVRTVKADEFDFGQYSNSNNIFAAGSSDSSSSIFSNYESQLNGMIQSAERYQKTMMLLSGISAGANLLNSAVDTVAGASSTGLSGNLFGNIGKLFGSGNKAAVADTAAASSSNLTSNLGAAISNYSSKGSTENWTALNNEIAKAKTDRESLVQVVSDSDAVVKEFNQQKPQLDQAVSDAKKEVNAAQKAVDDNKDGVQAEIRVNTINKTEIPAQNKIIEESDAKVAAAQGKFSTEKTAATDEITAADAAINSAQAIIDNPPKVMQTVNGQQVQVVDQSKVSQAQTDKAQAEQKKKDAEAKLKQAEEAFKAVLKAEVGIEDINAEIPASPTGGRKGAALSAKAKLEEELKKQEAIVQEKGGQDQMKAIIEARQKAGEKLEDAEAKLKEATDKKNAAVSNSGQASAQIKVLDKQIKEAESLLSKKQK